MAPLKAFMKRFPVDLTELSPDELVAEVAAGAEENARLKAEVARLAEENATLKSGPRPRPQKGRSLIPKRSRD
jgi:cell division protein FtsB